jgi:hypothetical protein
VCKDLLRTLYSNFHFFPCLGIGIDDTFVMIGAWRRTPSADSVPDRMAETFKDAAVSITITSITDMLSFWIGVITPFPCVQIFCVYCGKITKLFKNDYDKENLSGTCVQSLCTMQCDIVIVPFNL